MLITCWDETSQVLHVALKSNYLDSWLNTEPTDPYPFLAVTSTDCVSAIVHVGGLDGYCYYSLGQWQSTRVIPESLTRKSV